MRPRPQREAGFTYLGILIALVIMGLVLSAAGRVWSVTAQREREVQLLFIGDEFRTAIGRYYANGRQYPQSLEDLLEDRRTPTPSRYLRRLYADPMTGAADWSLVMAPGNAGIIGVASRSQLTPIKRTGFPPADASFENSECYCQWQFVYRLPARPRKRR